MPIDSGLPYLIVLCGIDNDLYFIDTQIRLREPHS